MSEQWGGKAEAKRGQGGGLFLHPHPTRRSLSLTTCHPPHAFRGGGIKRCAVGYHTVMPREGGASSTPSRTMTAEQRSLGVGWVERSDTHRHQLFASFHLMMRKRWSFPSLPRERERAVGREGRSEARPGWGLFLHPHPTRRSLSLTTCHPACAFRGGGIKRCAVGYHAVTAREGGASSTP